MIQKSMFKSKRSKRGRKVYFLKKKHSNIKNEINYGKKKKKEEKTNYFKSIFEKT